MPPSTCGKKRSSTEMEEADKDTLIQRLQDELASCKAKLATYEEQEESSDDEDDEEESVCDGSPFSKKIQKLKQFKAQHGHCKVPRKHEIGERANDMKKAFKKGKLAQDRMDKLNKNGFHWGKDFPDPPKWEERFAEVKKKYDTFGFLNVTEDVDPSKMTELAKWIVEQRKQGKRLRKEKRTTMIGAVQTIGKYWIQVEEASFQQMSSPWQAHILLRNMIDDEKKLSIDIDS